MTPVGFEPTFAAGERPQTYALDRAATGTGIGLIYKSKINIRLNTAYFLDGTVYMAVEVRVTSRITAAASSNHKTHWERH